MINGKWGLIQCIVGWDDSVVLPVVVLNQPVSNEWGCSSASKDLVCKVLR